MNSANHDSASVAANVLALRSVERDQVFELHPVVTDKAKVPTPAVKEAFELATSVIVHREPGICFVAESRFGKTFGIQAMRENLPQTFPGIPSFSVIAKEHDRPSECSFYTDMLMDCDHGVVDRGTARARRLRLLSMWIVTIQASGSDRLILFIDEAQNWCEGDFTWLRDLSNDVAEHKFRLITVMFAHPSLLTFRTTLLNGKRTDLIGRFMLHPNTFRGASTISDLIEIMKCYDDPDVSEFPDGSRISYSQFFRPHAYQEGWRLEDEAGACWAALSAEASKRGGHFEVGMQWIASSIRAFLYLHWKIEHGEPASAGDVWKEAVAGSGFEFALGVT